MEPNAELMRKLRRMRDRIGERSPLKDIDNTDVGTIARPSVKRAKDVDLTVKVKELCIEFEPGSENQSSPTGGPKPPGRLDLGRSWSRGSFGWELGTRNGATDDGGGTQRAPAPATAAAACAGEDEAAPAPAALAGPAARKPTRAPAPPPPPSRLQRAQRPPVAPSTPQQPSAASNRPQRPPASPAAPSSPQQPPAGPSSPQRPPAGPSGGDPSGGEEPEQEVGFPATQILTPLKDLCAQTPDFAGSAGSFLSGGKAQPRCFALSSGDPASPEVSISFCPSSPLHGGSGGPGLATSPGDGVEDFEPLEYLLLDHLSYLPEGFVDKLKSSLQSQEDLMQRLRSRHGHLLRRGRARPSRGGGAAAEEEGEEEASHPMASHPTDPVVAELTRQDQRVRAAEGRIAAAREGQLRVAAENYEMELRRMLARTRREAEEKRRSVGGGSSLGGGAGDSPGAAKDCQTTSRMAKLERERMQRELKNMHSEIEKTEVHIGELEELIRVEKQTFREKDTKRRALMEEVATLRREARAQRAQTGRRSRADLHAEDIRRELESKRAALAALGTTREAAPAAAPPPEAYSELSFH